MVLNDFSMTYRVALDDKSKEDKGAMAKTWMEAAGQSGIPSAFLVDKKGKIAWMGHPMELTEKTLDQVLEGTFDLKQADPSLTMTLHDMQGNRVWSPLVIRASELRNGSASWRQKMDRLSHQRFDRAQRGGAYYGTPGNEPE